MGSVHDDSSGLTAPASVFDNLTSAYDQVYSQGTLQTEYVQKLVSRLSPGQFVLDIGCATGVPNAVLLEKAGLKNVPSGRFILTDAKSFVPSETYDAVVCSLALLSEPSLWIDSLAYRISSWLKPTGLLLFGTIDFNDFPVAPGCPIDPTGLALRHTFMETSITDSTFEPGDWIKTLRQAGLRLLECDQKIFDPKAGAIEPEPQCFFLASKTAKHALLGPYKHPYKHLAAPRASNAVSWDFVQRRRVAGSERTSWFAPGAWKLASPAQLLENCPEGVVRIELDWVLDMAPPTEIAGNANLGEAEPETGRGTTQHHGSLISELLSCLRKTGSGADSSGVRVDLLPASLDFTDLPPAAFVENVARVFGDVWFAGFSGEGGELVEALLRRRIQAALDEFASLGQTDVGRIGFDCVTVAIDVGACQFD